MSSPQGYPGSCHCGFIQYSIRLTFPPIHDRHAKSIRLYKCNCSTCQKMGFFHCRPIDPAQDFILITPTDPNELGDYRAFAKTKGWYFCNKCGVRVFGMAGTWESVNVDVGKWAGTKPEEEADELQTVLKTRSTTRTKTVEGKEVTEEDHYVSVNAVTLEPSKDIDLRSWHEEGWIMYVDCRTRTGPPRLKEPYECGMY